MLLATLAGPSMVTHLLFALCMRDFFRRFLRIPSLPCSISDRGIRVSSARSFGRTSLRVAPLSFLARVRTSTCNPISKLFLISTIPIMRSFLLPRTGRMPQYPLLKGSSTAGQTVRRWRQGFPRPVPRKITTSSPELQSRTMRKCTCSPTPMSDPGQSGSASLSCPLVMKKRR